MTKRFVAQFWVGTIASEALFGDFLGENPGFWEADDPIEEGIPLSRFIESQGATWFDHDFLECGYSNEPGSLMERFHPHSYASQWVPVAEERMASLSIEAINTFVMLGIDEQPDGTRHYQVEQPRSHREAGIDLVFIGEIGYEHDFSWMMR